MTNSSNPSISWWWRALSQWLPVEHLGDLAFPGALAAGGIQVMDPLPADDARIADLTLETPWYS
ncbi:MAG: hypothetical protein ACKO50_11500 [Cyanobium sp.]